MPVCCMNLLFTPTFFRAQETLIHFSLFSASVRSPAHPSVPPSPSLLPSISPSSLPPARSFARPSLPLSLLPSVPVSPLSLLLVHSFVRPHVRSFVLSSICPSFHHSFLPSFLPFNATKLSNNLESINKRIGLKNFHCFFICVAESFNLIFGPYGDQNDQVHIQITHHYRIQKGKY